MAPTLVLNFRAVCTFLMLMFWISPRLHVLAIAENSPVETHDEHSHSDSIFGDPFAEILDRLNGIASAVSERNITYEETAGIIHSLFHDRMQCSDYFNPTGCKKCLHADTLFTILGVQPSHGLDEEHFNRACVVLFYYVTDLGSMCSDTSLSAQTYEYFVRGIQMRIDGALNLSEEELETMLDSVATSYAADNFAKCFTVETVFEAAVADHDVGADEHELENVATILISSLVRGFCIGNATEVDPEAFLDDIFDTYSTEGVISEDKFIEILGKLSIGGEEAGGGSEDPHGHTRRRRGTRDYKIFAGKSERHRRSTETDHGHSDPGVEGNLDIHACFSVDDLLAIFGVNHIVGVTRDQFKELSAALIQQAISDACVPVQTNTAGPSSAEVWGYGILAVFVISLCAVAGVAFLPCLDTALYQRVLQTMMALAVATLVGDAVIHLIPQAVGLHAHEASAADSGSEHGAGSEELAFIWKCLVVVGAVYVFFIFESLMGMFGGRHSHSLEPDSDPTAHKRANSSVKLRKTVQGPFKKSSSNAQLEMTDIDHAGSDATFPNGDVVHSRANNEVCCGIGSLPFMILIGDGLHNLGDGLAIGAAFATSLGAGLSTSIAVFCHELPHELGDFAVLLNAGLSFKKALGFNLLSAMMAFVGLCIGIPLASNEEARQWIFAVAAGMFLYVALVDMLPEIIHHELKNKGIIFLLHNVGFLIGTFVILIIALYEDSINISI